MRMAREGAPATLCDTTGLAPDSKRRDRHEHFRYQGNHGHFDTRANRVIHQLAPGVELDNTRPRLSGQPQVFRLRPPVSLGDSLASTALALDAGPQYARSPSALRAQRIAAARVPLFASEPAAQRLNDNPMPSNPRKRRDPNHGIYN